MKMLLYIIIIFVLFVVFVRYLERTSVFYPDRILNATPHNIDLPFEDVYIQTKDHVTIHGWLIKSPSAKSTLLYFHGNAGNIGDRIGKIEFLNKIGLNVLIIDYRGYGKSNGKPSEKGIYNDAIASYDYLVGRDDMEGQNIISYGASLGGAVAVDLATKRRISLLIVDSTFSSAADMAKRIYPFVPSFLIKTKLDSMVKIRNIDVPKLFIHSVDDQTVPISLGKKLYDVTPEPKEFIEITGDHTNGHLYDPVKIKNAMTKILNTYQLL